MCQEDETKIKGSRLRRIGEHRQAVGRLVRLAGERRLCALQSRRPAGSSGRVKQASERMSDGSVEERHRSVFFLASQRKVTTSEETLFICIVLLA